jgi:hypothetical protein
MLKYLCAAVLAVGLLAAPTLSSPAAAAQPAENTLITKPVADYTVPKKPKRYGAHRHHKHCCCCHYKKPKKHGPAGYKPPKPYKPTPTPRGY